MDKIYLTKSVLLEILRSSDAGYVYTTISGCDKPFTYSLEQTVWYLSYCNHSFALF